MNSRDQKNLKFLLELDAAGLIAWYAQATDDDINYASELLAQRDQELDQIEFALGQDEFGVAFAPLNSTLH
jgi:hypothetical protein